MFKRIFVLEPQKRLTPSQFHTEIKSIEKNDEKVVHISLNF